MGIQACKNQNCSYEYNLIENDYSDTLTTFDRKVFDEFKELRRKIENNSRVNQTIGLFVLSDPNKQFKRFVKWYKIAYTDPNTNKLKNKLSVKKLRNFFEISSNQKSCIDNNKNNNNYHHYEDDPEIKDNYRMTEKILEKHFFDFNEKNSINKKKNTQIIEISFCQIDKNSTSLKIERENLYASNNMKNYINDYNHNKERIKCDFEENFKNKVDENVILNENMNFNLNSNFNSGKNSKNNIPRVSRLKKKSKLQYEKEHMISFSLIRETELSISKSSSYDENNRDSSKFVQNNLKLFFNKNSEYFKDSVVKGLPCSFRWKVWMVCANITSPILESNFNLYYEMNLDEITDKQIQKDINRTYSAEKTDFIVNNVNKKEQLLKLLKAFANNDKEIGYCQGMNFISGLILEISDFQVVEAFYLMQSLFSNTFSDHLGIRGFYVNGFPLLHFYLFVFDDIFKKELSSLYNHFKSMNLPHDSWATKWFLSLFTICLPQQVTVRVWDCIFIHGINFIIKFSISLLDTLKEELIKTVDEFEIMDIFNSLKKENLESYKFFLDVEDIVKKALKIEIKDIEIYKENFEKKSKICLNKLDIKYDIKSSITYSLNTSLTNTTNLTITDIIHEQHNTSESSTSLIHNNLTNLKENFNKNSNFNSPVKKGIFGFSIKETVSDTFNLYKINTITDKNEKIDKNECTKNQEMINNNKLKNDNEEESNDTEYFEFKKRKNNTFLNYGSNYKRSIIENNSLISNSNKMSVVENEFNTKSSNNNLVIKQNENFKDCNNSSNKENKDINFSDTKKSSKKRNLLSCFEIVNNKNMLEFSSPNKKNQSSYIFKENCGRSIHTNSDIIQKESDKMKSFNRSSIKLKTVFSSKPVQKNEFMTNESNEVMSLFSEKNVSNKKINSNLFNINNINCNKNSQENTSELNKIVHSMNFKSSENKDVLYKTSTSLIKKEEKTIIEDDNFVEEEFDDSENNNNDQDSDNDIDYDKPINKKMINRFITKNNADIFKKKT